MISSARKITRIQEFFLQNWTPSYLNFLIRMWNETILQWKFPKLPKRPLSLNIWEGKLWFFWRKKISYSDGGISKSKRFLHIFVNPWKKLPEILWCFLFTTKHFRHVNCGQYFGPNVIELTVLEVSKILFEAKLFCTMFLRCSRFETLLSRQFSADIHVDNTAVMIVLYNWLKYGPVMAAN